MGSDVITIALAKGYLMKEGLSLLNKIGIEFDEDLSQSRKLFMFDRSGKYRILQIRPWDVPAYVQGGAADLGIVGLDVLEEKRERVNKLLDLEFGHCRLVLAGPRGEDLTLRHHLKVATKYPQSCQRYFNSRGLKVDMIKLYGAIELAPLTGLADIICDLTATGKTLEEHELDIMDTVFSSSALMIANPVSLKWHYTAIQEIVEGLKPHIGL